jgi:hypothetical protein
VEDFYFLVLPPRILGQEGLILKPAKQRLHGNELTHSSDNKFEHNLWQNTIFITENYHLPDLAYKYRNQRNEKLIEIL